MQGYFDQSKIYNSHISLLTIEYKSRPYFVWVYVVFKCPLNRNKINESIECGAELAPNLYIRLDTLKCLNKYEIKY